MKEYSSLFLTIIAIFLLLAAGAYFSATFEEQRTFLELFFIAGSLLFIFSVLVIFSAIGFKSFALFLTLFASIVLVIFGIEGTLLVVGMTYIFWGAIFAMEVLLFYNGVVSAQKWFEERYTFKSFRNEYYAFYPMMFMLYILLEWIPHFFYRERLLKFSPHRVLEVMKELLRPE
ncbi:hypothetical protein PGH07_02420 [Sulfurovum sp. zt1-1]|uniref:Uncharacterized protein n=1 Tax=Sulfurovum zhangzhouensis TaxID=3019067 RepID=A0ABT7QW62_9BACT|nr:hypothetical protein [Sulfurovum zhangzhouensis]MDM5271027.1 hypothetical protein [Sulfurovum zhangzhouensis]